MKSAMATYCREQRQNHMLKDKVLKLVNAASLLFYSGCLTILFSLYFLYHHPGTIESTSNIHEEHQTSKTFISPENGGSEKCDLFKGQWVPDQQGSLYTNFSCKTIPYKKNCFLHGRKDRDFLHWRWKPDECELPRFSPKKFLTSLQGKTMAFIGDSLGRNQMESLLCLLSMEENPVQVYKDAEDENVTWDFPKHNFTLMAFWSQFLVTAKERKMNGTATGGFDLYLEKIDENWSKNLPFIDYAIFSDAHWFFRQNYLYEGDKLIGCIYCQAPNVTDLGPSFAIRRAFKAAFSVINSCKNCKNIFTVLRTFSPAHFDREWNKGGGCNGTLPLSRQEVNRAGADWEYRKVQMEEVERARKIGEERGNKFEILDVTEAMAMRTDGHPGEFWGNKWMKGFNDCIHWCLPGPIDAWNELLLEVIRRK